MLANKNGYCLSAEIAIQNFACLSLSSIVKLACVNQKNREVFEMNSTIEEFVKRVCLPITYEQIFDSIKYLFVTYEQIFDTSENYYDIMIANIMPAMKFRHDLGKYAPS